MNRGSPVIEVRDLIKNFAVSSGFFGRPGTFLRAVDRVSLLIRRGETLGLVGESGSGKSTVGNCILRLLQPDGGQIFFRGRDLAAMNRRELQTIRGRVQVVFQDPLSSLDPRMTIKRIVGYPLTVSKQVRGAEVEDRVLAMLREVGLGKDHLHRYPHEFSGGQRQRIGMARALITEPECIMLDEPTSALDVSVQAQILNLIHDLQKRHGYAYLFITHDLAVVRHISHRIAVMYLGLIVESASKDTLFENPCHPYTRALMASAPRPDPFNRQDLAVLPGDPPSPVHIPPGCRFHPRCSSVMDVCRLEAPPRVRIAADHEVACHLYPST